MMSRSSLSVVVSSNFDRQVGRWGKTMLLLGHGLANAGGNGSQVFAASMLTVLWLISLTVALAVSSARKTGLDACMYMTLITAAE